MSYYDLTNGDLKVLHCNDPNCSGGDESITAPDTVDDVGRWTSLALDASGYPVVSYSDATNYDLKVLHCNDPNCAGGDESITSPDTAGIVGRYISLALDVSGFPVVSYYDATNYDLKVLHCNDPNCSGGDESITSPDTAGDVGHWTSVALDASGNPVVSYRRATNGDLRVLHCNDPNCQGEDESITSPDTAGNIGRYTSLALDGSGHPVVSYAYVPNGDLRVLHCNDPNCEGTDESITSPDTEGWVGQWTSLALDASGNPVVSYCKWDKNTFYCDDLKVLHCGDPACSGVKAPQLRLPFADNQDWYLTCGPHSWNPGCPSTEPVPSALDFQPAYNPDYPTVSYAGNCAYTGLHGPDDPYRVYPVAPGWVVDPVTNPKLPAGDADHYMEIDHGNGIHSVYFHLKDKPALAPGTWIERDQFLGYPSCEGGIASGPHLHFGVRDGAGNWLDIAGRIEMCGWQITNASPYLDRNGPPANGLVSCDGHPSGTQLFENTSVLTQGEIETYSIGIPPGQILLDGFAGWFGSSVDLSFTAPDGTIIDASTVDPDVFHVKGDTFEYYEIRNPQAGDWTLHLFGADLPPGGEPVTATVSACAQPPGDAAGDPCVADDDADGCTDEREIGGVASLGGLRDPLYFWDFFDLNLDRAIAFADFLLVLQHFNTNDDGGASTINRNTDPLSPAAETPAGVYSPRYDRGGQTGANGWNQAPANGSIAFADFLALLVQFGHSCA